MLNFTNTNSAMVHMISNSHDKVIYLEGVTGVTNIRFVEEFSDGCIAKKAYDYSPDGSTWAGAWYDDLEILKNDIKFSEFQYPTIYLRIKISLEYPDDVKNKMYGLHEVIVDSNVVKIRGIETIQNAKIVGVSYNGNLFKPSKGTENAVIVSAQMHKLVTKMVDIRCMYNKIKPNEDSANATLKVYENKDVTESKELQITFVGGKFPDERPIMNEWAFEVDGGFEIEINKELFREQFGADALPCSQDFLLMYYNNRWYEVNTVYEKRAIMNKAVHWVAQLVKWEDRASVDKGALQKRIDDFTKYIEDIDDFKLDLEERDATGKCDTVTDVLSNTKEVKVGETGNIKNNILAAAGSITAHSGFSVNGETAVRYFYGTDEEMLTTYKLNIPSVYSKVDDEGYSVCMWFIPSVVKGAKLFDTVGDKTIAQCTLTADGRVNFDITSETVTQVLTSKGSVRIEPNKPYFVMVNRIVRYQTSGSNRVCTISVLDSALNVIQEAAAPESDKNSNPSKLVVYGKKKVGNIRVYKNPIARDMVGAVAMTSNPAPETCYIIDTVKVLTKNENLSANV